MATFPGNTRHEDSSTDSDDSDSSPTTAVDSQYRLSERNRQRQTSTVLSSTVTGNRNTNGPSASNMTITSLPRPLSRATRRSEIRQELDSINNNSSITSSESNRPQGATGNGSSTVVQPRTGANRIDVNNNPLSSISNNTNQNSASNSQLANSVRRADVSTGQREVGRDVSRDISDNSSVSQQNRQEVTVMPRPSSTFRSALDTLPPISSPTRNTTDDNVRMLILLP